MIYKTLLVSAFVSLALTGCPTTPTPAISSIAVTGITAPVKLGGTATLTAKALDQNNTEMTGQNFTWTSSNPNIASVDANGVVTAKRLGTAKISAESSSIKGEIGIKTFGLEVVGGTYTASDGVIGTALTYKAIGADGNPPISGTKIKFIGPAGWRPGKPPVELTWTTPRAWGLQFTGLYTSPPVTGAFQAEMTIGTEKLTSAFDIDATKTIAAVTDVVKSNISTTGLNATWTLPASAFNFEVDVVEDPDVSYTLLLEQKVTTNTARFDAPLNATKAHQLDVFASDVDMSADNPTFPTQLNLSINFSRFNIPAASISVTVPTNNALKLNEATKLNALVKDIGGNTLNGKTLIWNSSDPSIASVDSNGNVTAKRFGTVTTTASVDGVTGSSAELNTFGFEVVGGFNPGNNNTTFFIRFRQPDGSGANTNVNMTIAGPIGWNSNQPYERNGFFLNNSWWFQSSWFGVAVVPVSGSYSASTTINSQTFTSSFSIDATKAMPAITGMTVTSASANSVTGSWNAVLGALSYDVGIWNDTDKKSEAGITVAGTSGTLNGLNLNPGKSYFFQVHALGADISAPLTTPITTQFNIVFDRVPFTF